MSNPWTAATQDKEWLPEADWKARHEEILAGKPESAEVFFFGDSITAGWLGAGEPTWNATWAPLSSYNAGIGGDETQHLLWRLENGTLDGLSPKVCSLLIGTNNIGNAGSSAEDTARGVVAVIDRLQAMCPGMTILVHQIFPRSEKADDAPRRTVNAANALLREALADRDGVKLLDFSSLFLQDPASDDLTADLMPDFLHLSPEAYAKWAEALLPEVQSCL